MTGYEKMLDMANQKNLQVYEKYNFSGTKIKGLYCDGNIALNRNIQTESEKKCILAEEIGHFETSCGDITDQNNVSNRKQELRAREWAYATIIPLSNLIKAYKNGCRNRYEIAEYLDVTEEFLQEAIEYYKSQYGVFHTVGKYIIYFEPLGVMKLL